MRLNAAIILLSIAFTSVTAVPMRMRGLESVDLESQAAQGDVATVHALVRRAPGQGKSGGGTARLQDLAATAASQPRLSTANAQSSNHGAQQPNILFLNEQIRQPTDLTEFDMLASVGSIRADHDNPKGRGYGKVTHQPVMTSQSGGSQRSKKPAVGQVVDLGGGNYQFIPAPNRESFRPSSQSQPPQRQNTYSYPPQNGYAPQGQNTYSYPPQGHAPQQQNAAYLGSHAQTTVPGSTRGVSHPANAAYYGQSHYPQAGGRPGPRQ
ncbi:hypothetical protein K474DRAFT_1711403 [Panus rudis PR-1116 ss-1]|nr:hypothetical protein K474DRAFT_1711403 [Panus rudis PR-1116 ss-1]